MQRRAFLHGGLTSLAAASLGLSACSTAITPTTSQGAAQGANAEQRKREINTAIDTTLARLDKEVSNAPELRSKAAGVLVFPTVLAAGFVIGGQYGEGALRVNGVSLGYYSVASVSVGLTAGAQSKAIVLLFMTQDSLNKFRTSNGWSAGVDASVAVLKVGANGVADTGPGAAPVLAFVLTNAGLMANLSLEGTKVSPLRL